MYPTDALEIMNKKFVWTSDSKTKSFRDHWRILDTDPDKIYGDCEDFSLTLLYLINDKNMLRFFKDLILGRAKLYYVKYKPSDNGHAVLYYRGAYVCNIYHQWCMREEMKNHKFYMSFPFPFIALKLAIAKIIDFFWYDRQKK